METNVYVITVVKEPHSFQKWLHWYTHVNQCKVFAIYDSHRVEENDTHLLKCIRDCNDAGVDFKQAYKNPNGKYSFERTKVAPSSSTATVFSESITRQQDLVDLAIKEIRSKREPGCVFVMHVDADELVISDKPYRPIREVINDVYCVQEKSYWLLPNYEARVNVTYFNDEEKNDIFSATHFEIERTKFLAYTNGKGFARLEKDTVSFGPHCFKNESQSHAACQGEYVDDLAVLHFNCTTFDLWKKKYERYRDVPRNDSVFLFDQMSTFMAPHSNDDLLKAFYLSRMHVDPFSTTIVNIPVVAEMLANVT
jgi:hypothetical protein